MAIPVNAHNHRIHGATAHALAGCLHVYVDIGCNTGERIRSLWEPDKYAPSPAQDGIRRLLGSSEAAWRSSVCVLCVESDPSYEAILHQMADEHARRGFRTVVLTRTDIGRIDRWLQHEVLSRRLPEHRGIIGRIIGGIIGRSHHRPVVVLHVDIRARGARALPRALASGVLCALDALYVRTLEWTLPVHERPAGGIIDRLRRGMHQAGPKCALQIKAADFDGVATFEPVPEMASEPKQIAISELKQIAISEPKQIAELIPMPLPMPVPMPVPLVARSAPASPWAPPPRPWRAPNCTSAGELLNGPLGAPSRAAEAASTATGGVRLALITLLGPDAEEMVDRWLRYYVREQRTAPSDVFIIELPSARIALADTGGVEAQIRQGSREVSRFGHLYRTYGVPRENIFERRILRNEREGRASYSRIQSYSELWRQDQFKTLQNRLILSGSYTHTLVADVDELVWPNRDKYASLHDYLRANQARALIATNGFSVYESRDSLEAGLDWKAPGLLRQRHWWRGECAECKPVISRLPTNFSFSTHEIEEVPVAACRGRPLDCVDPDLVMVHVKCIDFRAIANKQLAKHFQFSGMNDERFLESRCHVVDRHYQSLAKWYLDKRHPAPTSAASSSRTFFRNGSFAFRPSHDDYTSIEPIPEAIRESV